MHFSSLRLQLCISGISVGGEVPISFCKIPVELGEPCDFLLQVAQGVTHLGNLDILFANLAVTCLDSFGDNLGVDLSLVMSSFHFLFRFGLGILKSALVRCELLDLGL